MFFLMADGTALGIRHKTSFKVSSITQYQYVTNTARHTTIRYNNNVFFFVFLVVVAGTDAALILLGCSDVRYKKKTIKIEIIIIRGKLERLRTFWGCHIFIFRTLRTFALLFAMYPSTMHLSVVPLLCTFLEHAHLPIHYCTLLQPNTYQIAQFLPEHYHYQTPLRTFCTPIFPPFAALLSCLGRNPTETT